MPQRFAEFMKALAARGKRPGRAEREAIRSLKSVLLYIVMIYRMECSPSMAALFVPSFKQIERAKRFADLMKAMQGLRWVIVNNRIRLSPAAQSAYVVLFRVDKYFSGLGRFFPKDREKGYEAVSFLMDQLMQIISLYQRYWQFSITQNQDSANQKPPG